MIENEYEKMMVKYAAENLTSLTRAAMPIDHECVGFCYKDTCPMSTAFN